MDNIDRDIIKILQDNARTSYREIKDELGISIGTIHNRIAKLKKKNIIESYTIRLNNKKLGYELTFLIRMNIDGKFTDKILNELKERTEVCSIFHTTGEQSAALICRFKNSEDVNQFIRELNKKDYIRRTVSNLVLKEYKSERDVLL
ncbi:MAG: Lrp/AsnC family transcriptional regulator [Promethearchaeota archaeon]|nr:MAG: Lrp/AsnC family transcriptional regulator [Candidatus Lokiarchaeota archaeon]